MSLSISFEPHSQYMGFIIKKNENGTIGFRGTPTRWLAFTENGNAYRVDKVEADTIKELHCYIRLYHLKQRNGYGERITARRLKTLRAKLRAERIDYDELVELQKLEELKLLNRKLPL